MVEFREIKEDNFAEVIKLKVEKSQERFLAPILYSLAQAWLYYENHDIFPYAVYADDVPVGFVLFEIDDEEHEAIIWRIMIDEHFQGKGYGREALRLAVSWIKDLVRFDRAILTCCPDNHRARRLYDSFGFKPTGRMFFGEDEMEFLF